MCSLGNNLFGSSKIHIIQNIKLRKMVRPKSDILGGKSLEFQLSIKASKLFPWLISTSIITILKMVGPILGVILLLCSKMVMPSKMYFHGFLKIQKVMITKAAL